MKPSLKIVLDVVAVLVGVGFVMPAVSLWRSQSSLPGGSVGLLLLGLTLTGAGFYSGTTGIRRLKN